MASIDELSNVIESCRSEIEQVTASVGAAMSNAEELGNQTLAIGLEGKSSQAMQVKESLEQVQNGLMGLVQATEAARAQAEAMRGLQGGTGGGVPAGGGEKAAPTPAGDSGGGKGPTEPPRGGPPIPAEPDDGNGDSRDDPFQNVVGEPLEPLPELDLDEDSGSRIGQAGRSMYKKMADYQKFAKDAGQSAQSLLSDGYQPFRGGQAQTETIRDTGAANPAVTTDNQAPVHTGDVIGTALVGVASLMHGVGWVIDWRRRRRNDGAD